jgi:hypothetical protein
MHSRSRGNSFYDVAFIAARLGRRRSRSVSSRSHSRDWPRLSEKMKFNPMQSKNPGVLERADDGRICAFSVEFERRFAILVQHELAESLSI